MANLGGRSLRVLGGPRFPRDVGDRAQLTMFAFDDVWRQQIRSGFSTLAVVLGAVPDRSRCSRCNRSKYGIRPDCYCAISCRRAINYTLSISRKDYPRIELEPST